MPGFSALGSEPSKTILFDHRPLRLNDDDYQRVCHVPVKKVRYHLYILYVYLMTIYEF